MPAVLTRRAMAEWVGFRDTGRLPIGLHPDERAGLQRLRANLAALGEILYPLTFGGVTPRMTAEAQRALFAGLTVWPEAVDALGRAVERVRGGYLAREAERVAQELAVPIAAKAAQPIVTEPPPDPKRGLVAALCGTLRAIERMRINEARARIDAQEKRMTEHATERLAGQDGWRPGMLGATQQAVWNELVRANCDPRDSTVPDALKRRIMDKLDIGLSTVANAITSIRTLWDREQAKRKAEAQTAPKPAAPTDAPAIAPLPAAESLQVPVAEAAWAPAPEPLRVPVVAQDALADPAAVEVADPAAVEVAYPPADRIAMTGRVAVIPPSPIQELELAVELAMGDPLACGLSAFPPGRRGRLLAFAAKLAQEFDAYLGGAE